MADLRAAVRRGRTLAARARTARLPPYSRLYLVGERANWVTRREMYEVGRTVRMLGADVGDPRDADGVRGQAVFYGSQFDFFARDPLPLRNRVGIAYYHGLPGTPGYPDFDRGYALLREHRKRIDRVQVTHSQMREVVLSTGIDPERVFTIPIGINLDYFPLTDPDSRAVTRARLGIPDTAVVVGSFQKDGVGWNDGREPKTIKGPDVFVEAVARLHGRIPELFVLLTGPARGYVIDGLERHGIAYRHVYANEGDETASLAEIGRLFHALDLYVVASRQEGGPKAVLESMATGIPLVTTRVGHAMDLIEHGANGWIVDVDDVDGLAHWAEHVLTHPSATGAVLRRARTDAEGHAYEAQLPLWRELLTGFVELPER